MATRRLTQQIMRKQKKGEKRHARSGPFFQLVDDPFGGVEFEERAEHMAQAGREAAQAFTTTLESLQQLLSEFDPLQVLTTLSARILTAGVTASGKTKPILTHHLNQSHVELVQALLLKSARNNVQFRPLFPNDFSDLSELLFTVGHSFNSKRFVQILDAQSNADRAVLRLQERVRTHTQFVRNWGYFKRVVATLNELYGELDALCLQRHGVTTTALIRLFERHTQNIEVALTAQHQLMASVLKGEGIAGMVSAYFEQLTDLEGSEDEMTEFFRSKNASREQVFAMLLGHADLRLVEDYCINVPAMAAQIGTEQDALRKFLPTLALQFGELADADPEHFFLHNPIWQKPLITLSNDKYFCSMPQVFFGFSLKILDALFNDDADSRVAVQERRAKYLEVRTRAVFEEALPDTTVIPNVGWSVGGERFENDLCVLCDTKLFIVEAKSAAVSQPALRGAAKRAKRHIEDLFVMPAKQSQRLQTELERFIRDPASTEIRIDDRLEAVLGNVRSVHRLAVTLEDFATVQSHMGHIADTGWISESVQLTPVMTLPDLQVAFSLLPSTMDKFHYLIRRETLQQQVAYVGDEMDLIALYLDTAFDFGEEFHDGRPVVITGYSEKVDEFFVAADQGIERRSPMPRRTQWWRDMLTEIERRSFVGWLDAASMLADVGYESQRRAEKLFKKVKKSVKRNWRRLGHQNSATLEPRPWRENGLALMAYRKRQRTHRNQMMEGVAATVFSRSHAKRCLIVAVDIDETHYPYNSLAMFQRPSE